ncbi:hypothetical protein [uncultured Polaribacter sp.]|uniref:hypothetical protein n=1 Tax=uncultured Polaribacter sp. TaxID=174711 RepID=UPI00261E334F|nr:hypothetical protein [uncultured Polaribacter sp.]
MRKEITENESIAIDFALKKYLDLYQEGEKVFKKALPFFMKEFVTEGKRIKFIISELRALNLLTYKNERGIETLGHKFNRKEISEFLKNGGMTKLWLEKESKRLNIKLINKTLEDYKTTKYISWISLAIALILLFLKLTGLDNK